MLLSVATILLILGPDGGKNGGMVIAYSGTPEQVAKIEKELYWSIFEENT